MKAFYGMGFNFFEGYGLTETAPVLTVTSPKEKPIAGSVGRPLPGIEVKIAEPDGATGVGEVIARGRNVMAGYWENESATAEAIRDGWFHTGDLGRFDEKGNLYLVGRSKDVIVDANGKNVYPDEIEELYARHPLHQGAVGGRRPRRHRRAGRLRGGPRSRARSGAVARRRSRRRSRSTSGRSRPTCRSGSGCAACTSGTEDLPKTAKRSVKRRDVAAEIARLRKKSRGDQGGAGGRLAATAGRSAGCSTRSPPSPGASAPTCSSAAASASWGSTA